MEQAVLTAFNPHWTYRNKRHFVAIDFASQWWPFPSSHDMFICSQAMVSHRLRIKSEICCSVYMTATLGHPAMRFDWVAQHILPFPISSPLKSPFVMLRWRSSIWIRPYARKRIKPKWQPDSFTLYDSSDPIPPHSRNLNAYFRVNICQLAYLRTQSWTNSITTREWFSRLTT